MDPKKAILLIEINGILTSLNFNHIQNSKIEANYTDTNAHFIGQLNNDDTFQFNIPFENDVLNIRVETYVNTLFTYLSRLFTPQGDSEFIEVNVITTLISEYTVCFPVQDADILIPQKLQLNSSEFDKMNLYSKNVLQQVYSYVLITTQFIPISQAHIYKVLAQCILEQNDVVNLATLEFATDFVACVENAHSTIAAKGHLIQLLYQLSTESLDSLFDSIEKPPGLPRSLFTFYSSLQLTTNLGYEDFQRPDFRIRSNFDVLQFKPNDFKVEWCNSTPNSSGASTIEFFVDASSQDITIEPLSDRAQSISWLKTMSLEELFKGLYGELLLNLQDSLSIHYDSTGYICESSLEKNIHEYSTSYFKESHDTIVHNLQSFYRVLWNENKLAYGTLNLEQTFTIPIEVEFRNDVKDPSMPLVENRVENVWYFEYVFSVKS